jgi:hypothetical protein
VTDARLDTTPATAKTDDPASGGRVAGGIATAARAPHASSRRSTAPSRAPTGLNTAVDQRRTPTASSRTAGPLPFLAPFPVRIS